MKLKILDLLGKTKSIGLVQMLVWLGGRRGSVCKLSIFETDVWLRRGSPDLSVAIETLGGEFSLASRFLARDYAGVIVDAGGYVGTSAIALSQMFPNAKVVTIEPERENFSLLQKNIRAWPRIQSIRGALVGEENERVSLFDPGKSSWGFTATQEHQHAAHSKKLYSVRAYRLSQLGTSLNEIGLLKMDIEGGELDLLENDAESVQKIPIVVAELHERFVQGCHDAFMRFSGDRLVIKEHREKYWSIANNISTCDEAVRPDVIS